MQDILHRDPAEASRQFSARAPTSTSENEAMLAALLESVWPSDSTRMASDVSTHVANPAAANELQGDVQTIMASILSVNNRPAVWDAQLSELQEIDMQLRSGLLSGLPDLGQWFQQVQGYTASVTADFAEYTRNREQQQSRHRQQHQQQHQHHQHVELEALTDMMQLFKQVLRRL